ncbi:tRNA (guanine(9)-N(1))-methyltransferase [Coemansia sp. RSA 1807]|nr:tRNA (guanine(9)-N(1))-methyltransferase [Coemansia sp. RSA 1807]
MDVTNPGDETAPSTKRHRPNTPITKGPSVDNFTPTTMTLDAFNQLSRNQKKKILRQELWDQRSGEFREKQRAKRSVLRKRHKQRVRLGEVPAKRKLDEQERSGHKIIIDMDFDDKMHDTEIKSICSQLVRCYSTNRHGPLFVDLHITKLHERCRARFDKAIADHTEWPESRIKFHDTELLDVFGTDKLVYLTADSPNEITELDTQKVYVVGGLVDKNRYKRLTLDKAEQMGVAHARLPIGQYVQMASRKVITVNQIFEILVKFVEAGDWKQAFLEVIPQRKFNEGKGGGAKVVKGAVAEDAEDVDQDAEDVDDADENTDEAEVSEVSDDAEDVSDHESSI